MGWTRRRRRTYESRRSRVDKGRVDHQRQNLTEESEWLLLEALRVTCTVGR